MGHTGYYVTGIAVGILMVAVVGIVRKLGKKKSCADFDERQLRERGRACQYGFFTLMIYNLLYMAVFGEKEPEYFTHTFGIGLGMGIALLVFGVCAIWKNAYMGLNERPSYVYLVLGGVGAANLACGVRNICGNMSGTGRIEGYMGLSVIIGIVMLLLFAVFFARNYLNRHEEEAE